jgi:hypothetical protein
MRGADGVGDVANQDEVHQDDDVVSSSRQPQALLSGSE